MGQEIESSRFSQADFDNFTNKLRDETTLLDKAFKQKQFSDTDNIIGFEIEAWLVSPSGAPAPVNQKFLDILNNPLVVHELAAFNVELNSEPLELHGESLSIMQRSLESTWRACRKVANELSVDMMMIGILPSVENRHLSIANMSRLNRYQALNEQIIRHRQGMPLELDINGQEHIQTTHRDVMLESACTSLQLHLQTSLPRAANLMNLSMIVSGPVIAAAANSPYLFGRQLWEETRIPLFEQSVSLGQTDYPRVTFGHDYIHESMMEWFIENLEQYPVLVPIDEDAEPEHFQHLRFHNGTIWRWNRPLIGIDHQMQPHLRIEHRVIPAGPTITDCIANAAFYFGLVNGLYDQASELVKNIAFSNSRDNFYQCARQGLEAHIGWGNNNTVSVRELLLTQLLPAAKQGLAIAGVDTQDIDKYMGVMEARIEDGQNGAAWQRRWVKHHGNDMQRLSCSYLQRQNDGKPVHEWNI